MTLPGVKVNELDGQLGVMSSAGNGKLFAVVGPATAGPFNTPSVYSRVKDLVAEHGGGAGVEACAYWIERYQRPVIFVRTATSGLPTIGAVQHQATGTSVITVEAGAAPTDDHEVAVEILAGGTVGQAGIAYRVSFDKGRTWGARQSLGTSNEIVLGNGVTLDMAAGTVVTGDVHTVNVQTAKWSSTDLQAALAPLGLTSLQWEVVYLAGGVIDATTFAAAEAVTSFTNGKHVWIGSPRLPNAGETEAAYRTALEPLRAAVSTKHASLYAGGCKAVSAISARNYRRPASWGAACRQAAVAEHINIADVDLGAMPGISIRDDNGMPDEHDEAVYPGLDDLGFATLRTHPKRGGTYITRPRVFAPAGSDFSIMPNRRVLNLVHEALSDYLLTILHKPLLVSRKTGLILSHVAKDIEIAADAVLAAAVLSTPKASGAYFKLSRTDNLLSLPKLTCGAKVLPLAYPDWIELDLSFENPALNIQAV